MKSEEALFDEIYKSERQFLINSCIDRQCFGW